MKKKLLAVLTAMVMVLGSAATVFALPSTEGMTVEIISAIDKDGNELIDAECHQIRLRPIQEEDRPSVDEVSVQRNLKIVMGDNYAEDLQVMNEADVYVWDVENEKIIDWLEGAAYHFPVTITFRVPGVKADSKVHVLHGYDGYNGNEEDGTISVAEWHEEGTTTVGENTVTVTFAHLSPVLFLIEGEESDVQSPTTGESNVMLYAGLVAVVAFAGVVLTRKSVKSAK